MQLPGQIYGEVLSEVGRNNPSGDRSTPRLTAEQCWVWVFCDGMSISNGFSEAKELKAMFKIQWGEYGLWWMHNSGQRPAAGEKPSCCHDNWGLSSETELRHLGMRTLETSVLGSPVKRSADRMAGLHVETHLPVNRFLWRGHNLGG